MSSAICNTCGSLVHWPHSKGYMKKQSCACGSKDLQAVKGELVGDSWQYSDRHGIIRKTEPVFHGAHRPHNTIQ
jgi:hypothetical protein